MKLFAATAAGLVVAAAATTTPEPTTSPTTSSPTTSPTAPTTPAPTASPTTTLFGLGTEAAGALLGVKAVAEDCRGDSTDYEPDGLTAIGMAGPNGVPIFIGEAAGQFETCALTEYAPLVQAGGCILGDIMVNGFPQISFDFLDGFEPSIPAPGTPEFIPWIVQVMDPILSSDTAKTAFQGLIASLATDFIPETLDTLLCNGFITADNHTTFYETYVMAVSQGGLLAPPAPTIPEERALPSDCSALQPTIPIDYNFTIIGSLADQIGSLLDATNVTEEEAQLLLGQTIGACVAGSITPETPTPPTGQAIETFLMSHIAQYESDVDAIISALIDPELKLQEVLALVAFPYEGQLCPVAAAFNAIGSFQCVLASGTAPAFDLVGDLVFPGDQFPYNNQTSCDFYNKVPETVVPANLLAQLDAGVSGAFGPGYAAVGGLQLAEVVDMLLGVIPLAADTCTTPITDAPTPPPTTEAPTASSATTAAVSAAAAAFAAALLL